LNVVVDEATTTPNVVLSEGTTALVGMSVSLGGPTSSVKQSKSAGGNELLSGISSSPNLAQQPIESTKQETTPHSMTEVKLNRVDDKSGKRKVEIIVNDNNNVSPEQQQAKSASEMAEEENQEGELHTRQLNLSRAFGIIGALVLTYLGKLKGQGLGKRIPEMDPWGIFVAVIGSFLSCRYSFCKPEIFMNLFLSFFFFLMYLLFYLFTCFYFYL
jgi:hypothetical protein